MISQSETNGQFSGQRETRKKHISNVLCIVLFNELRSVRLYAV